MNKPLWTKISSFYSQQAIFNQEHEIHLNRLNKIKGKLQISKIAYHYLPLLDTSKRKKSESTYSRKLAKENYSLFNKMIDISKRHNKYISLNPNLKEKCSLNSRINLKRTKQVYDENLVLLLEFNSKIDGYKVKLSFSSIQ